MSGPLEKNMMINSVKTCAITSYNDFSPKISAKENKRGKYLQRKKANGKLENEAAHE